MFTQLGAFIPIPYPTPYIPKALPKAPKYLHGTS